MSGESGEGVGVRFFEELGVRWGCEGFGELGEVEGEGLGGGLEGGPTYLQ